MNKRKDSAKEVIYGFLALNKTDGIAFKFTLVDNNLTILNAKYLKPGSNLLVKVDADNMKKTKLNVKVKMED